MSIKNHQLQLLSRSLIAGFSASGRMLTSDTCHHLLHAAIGTVAPEVAATKKIPIEVRLDPSTLQYNLYATIQRAKTRLKTDDWQAMAIAEEVIEALRKARIGVNQVRLLLDTSIHRKVKSDAFKALRKNLELNDFGVEMTPKTATLAIAAGVIPKPDLSWKGRFSLACAFPSRHHSELVELVTKNECYFWAFPPTHSDATSLATLDRYFGESGSPSAEMGMGMGFSIIQAAWQRPKYPLGRDLGNEHYNNYALTTPMWACHVKTGKWRLGNLLRSSIHDGASWSSDRLIDVLPGGLASLPRIHGCHTCRTLFIDKSLAHPDVPTSCLCAEHGASTGVNPQAHPNS